MINFSHLTDVEETYFQHLRFAAWAGCVLVIIGIVSIIHAVFPFMFSRTPDKLFNYFLEASQDRRTRVSTVLKDKGVE